MSRLSAKQGTYEALLPYIISTGFLTVQLVPWLVAQVVQSVSCSSLAHSSRRPAWISDFSTTSFRFLARSALRLSWLGHAESVQPLFDDHRHMKGVVPETSRSSRLLICNRSHRPFCCLDLCRLPVHASPSASIPKALQNVNAFFIKD